MTDFNTDGRFSLPALLGINPGKEIDDGLLALRDAIAAVMAGIKFGTWAAKPAPSADTSGLFYFATDLGYLLLDDGTSYQLVNGPLIGQAVEWYGTEEPPGGYFMFPDGRTLQTNQYPVLAALRGVTGPTFPLTDHRGRVCVAPDNMQTARGAAGRVTAPHANTVDGVGGEERHKLLRRESGVNASGTTTNVDVPVNLTGGLWQPRVGGPKDGNFNPYNPIPGYTAIDGWTQADPEAFGIGADAAVHGHGLVGRDADDPHENMQPYFVGHYLIRVK